VLKLIDIITPKGILPNIRSRYRDEAVCEILEHLVTTDRISEDQLHDLLVEILKRETMGTTGIGSGVAIPHIKTDKVKGFVGALAVAPNGIEFNSIDSEPVKVVILFLSPVDAVSGHLQLLSHIGGILRHQGYLQLLAGAETHADLVELVEDAERMIFGLGPGGDEVSSEGPDAIPT
jgi:nitrogen PTS system EIIA component